MFTNRVAPTSQPLHTSPPAHLQPSAKETTCIHTPHLTRPAVGLSLAPEVLASYRGTPHSLRPNGRRTDHAHGGGLHKTPRGVSSGVNPTPMPQALRREYRDRGETCGVG